MAEHEKVKEPDLVDGILAKALAAVTLELKRIEPIQEGLNDYLLLDLHDETRADVTNAIALYDQRVALLEAVKIALEALLELVDVMPVVEHELAAATTAAGLRYRPIKLPPVSQAVYDDLADNQRTITAAFGEFEVAREVEADHIELEWGTPEDQPKEEG